MTPLPSPEELAARHLYNPNHGTVHIRDLINQAKDGLYVKDVLSDYVIGLLLAGKAYGLVKAWEGTLFQIPFVKGMKLRSNVKHAGEPFLDMHGAYLTIEGRALHGGSTDSEPMSLLDLGNIKHDDFFEVWKNAAFFAGRGEGGTIYQRVRSENTLKDCDRYVNSQPYKPGPESEPQPDNFGPVFTTPAKAAGSGSSTQRQRQGQSQGGESSRPASSQVSSSDNLEMPSFPLANKGKGVDRADSSMLSPRD